MYKPFSTLCQCLVLCGPVINECVSVTTLDDLIKNRGESEWENFGL